MGRWGLLSVYALSVYLAVVIDFYSRQVVGWSMAEHRRTKLVNDALLMAVWKRQPEKGLLWYTDRRSQYASDSPSLIKATRYPAKHEP